MVNPCQRSCNVTPSKNWITLFFIAVPIIVVYSNILHVPWLLDDKPNILDNLPLHISNLLPETLWNTFFAKPLTNELYRPVSCLTFALNWFWGQDNVIGYHVVNIFIHILTAFGLYLVITLLCATPRLKDKYTSSAVHNLALIAAILWAIHPIQIQAVTYIVQRMTALAAMFYVFGMLVYLKSRLAEIKRKKYLLSLNCILFYLFALGSKENTIIFPLTLILLEWIFFPQQTKISQKKKIIYTVFALTVILIATMIMDSNIFGFVTNYYQNRQFTITERLLTESRVIFFYISLLLYPAPKRFSIEHDFPLSISLLHPPQTLIAIIAILTILIVAFRIRKNYPLFSFAILFFFLNHIIESTILPLELVFEHRNYLPSLFFFLPIALLFHHLIERTSKYHIAKCAILISLSLLILFEGTATAARNEVWKTEQSLWADAAVKAPDRARPLAILAQILAWPDITNQKNLNNALNLYKIALTKNNARKKIEADIWGNMGSIYFHLGENEKAISHYQKAAEIYPEKVKLFYDLIKPLVIIGRMDQALSTAETLLIKDDTHADYFNIGGFILLHQNNPQKALLLLQEALRLNHSRPDIMLNIGKALSLNGNFAQAHWFYGQARNLAPQDLTTMLALIENFILAEDSASAYKTATILFSSFSVTQIQNFLQGINKNPHAIIPLDIEILSPVLRQALCGTVLCEKEQ